MGLARLLSVGKTFGAASRQDHRYRALPGAALPKLGAAARRKNLETTMKTTTRVPPTGKKVEAPVSQTQPERAQAPAAALPGQASARAAAPVSWWRQAGRFFLDGWGPKKVAGARRARIEAEGPVQQELALENVKPCRNDLSDADWEMTPPQPARPKGSFFRKLSGGRAALPNGQAQAEASVPAGRM